MRPTAVMTHPHAKREAAFAILCFVASLILYWMLFDHILHKVYDSYYFPNLVPFYGGLLFLGCVAILFYAAMLHNLCLIGNYLRQIHEHVPDAEEVETIFDAPAPTLTVLVPSYKEERQVIWQTLMSAALSEYPAKRVVLLIDNPPVCSNAVDQEQLDIARALPHEFNAEFQAQAAIYQQAAADYTARAENGTVNATQEVARIAALYDQVAQWLEVQTQKATENAPLETLSFDLRFFVETILMSPTAIYRERAAQCRAQQDATPSWLKHHYAMLTAVFATEFSSFERKKYANLSHDANKAMNLNSYIRLIGYSWKEAEKDGKTVLRKCQPQEATFSIPASDYINTIDADTLMTHDYVSRLVYFLERPENARIAVAQAPCSAIPGSPVPIERIGGAEIDTQYHTHQGYTYWDASFWVGANAMLRMTALNAIRERVRVNGKMVVIYIQDRTLIEDTESTIDLVHKGWTLYNYPARMTFSAMPSDFGSLLIQRRRWSNGGLIILPKLLNYAIRAPKNLRLLKEFFMRFNYLAMTTLSIAVIVLFAFYSFSPRLSTPLFIYANIPLLLLHSRDLKVCGHRYSDAFRTSALRLMLLPIIAAGVLKQMQQILTGRKIPFGRTPKVKSRTGAPALYYLMELGMIGYCIYMTINFAREQEWAQVAFVGMNLMLLLYALVRYIGIRAMAQDLWASFKQLLGAAKS